MVDRIKWGQTSIIDQMGNIHSEVGRSIAAKKADDNPRFQAALVRALDLFDATIESLVEQKSSRAKEVLRAKNIYLALFFSDQPVTMGQFEAIDKYFLQYATATRMSN